MNDIAKALEGNLEEREDWTMLVWIWASWDAREARVIVREVRGVSVVVDILILRFRGREGRGCLRY